MTQAKPSPFAESLQEKARDIKARVLSGEKIPLAEVIALMSDSAKALAAQKKAEVKKPTDVDFF